MNKIFKKILNDNKGGATIMITVMIMMTILTVSFSLSNVVINGLRVSVNQANATKAYYAAESSAEQFLWEIRKNGFDPEFVVPPALCVDQEYVFDDFSGCDSTLDASTVFDLTSGASFYIFYEFATPTTTITNFGEYKDTRRAVRLVY